MINHIDDLANFFVNNNSSNSVQKQKSGNDNLFRQSLEEALTNTEASDKKNVSSVSSLKEISSDEWTVKSENLNIETKTDSLLKMLNDYSMQLGDNKTSLKEIDSFLQDIKDSANDLLEETASSEHADTNLKNIAEQCAITANTEYMKFQRGDYI